MHIYIYISCIYIYTIATTPTISTKFLVTPTLTGANPPPRLGAQSARDRAMEPTLEHHSRAPHSGTSHWSQHWSPPPQWNSSLASPMEPHTDDPHWSSTWKSRTESPHCPQGSPTPTREPPTLEAHAGIPHWSPT